jgi:type I restriction enzyme M protein
LGDQEGKQAVQELLSHWQGLGALYSYYQAYQEQLDFAAIAEANKQQRALRAHFDPFFTNLHAGLKVLDKIVRRQEKATGNKQRGMKQLKEALEQLHKEVNASEGFYRHIHWLQERFPEAAYEDVTGLCKLATPEEVKEQDFSLNPGRYVGVVIEEDGKTEEEFIEELLAMNQQLETLNQEAIALADVIGANIRELTGE